MNSRFRTPGIATLLFAVLFIPTLAGAGPSAEHTWRRADGTEVPKVGVFVPPIVKNQGNFTLPPGAGTGTLSVAVEVVVGMGGGAAAVRVIRADRVELIAPALKAAEETVFQPATIDGRPIAVRYQLRFEHRVE